VAQLIESRFRADKTDRVISGSSLGGLFAIAAAYKAPGFFAGHIAISPAAGRAERSDEGDAAAGRIETPVVR
jgi:predicted alpha/beta superfamily hydrolase